MDDRPETQHGPGTVGFLSLGDLTDEQRLAREVASEVWDTQIDVLDADALAHGDASERHDRLWWHRAEPIGDELTPGLAGALESYVTQGGDLLVSLYAMTAVDDLGVDPHPPDRIDDDYRPVHTWEHRPSGFLVTSRLADRPPFDGFDALRIHTQPCERESVPRVAYDRRLPEHGVVLASTVVGEEDRPNHNSVIAWEHGEGRVLGIGRDVNFEAGIDTFETELRTLLAGIDRFFAADVRFGRRPYTAEALTELRAETAPDPHRPTYHFSPPANWLNDPNGLVYWNDRYHLFYQYNPGGPYHGTIHWGHAESDDLVHWTDRSVALTPSLEGPDRDGCWSGCMVVDDGQPTVVYTGADGRKQLPCIARARDDDLAAFEKHPGNPVIESPPDANLYATEEWDAEFRDHEVWREDGTWYHLVGSGIVDEGGTVFLYRSPDLTEWTYAGTPLVGERDETGGIWECPDFMDFGGEQVLAVSNLDSVIGFRGSFDGDTFDVDRQVTFDHGNFYASQSIPDGDRYLSWGWIREDREESAQWDAGWSGALSVPREISLDDELSIRPAPELSALRSDHESVDERSLDPDDDNPLADVEGAHLEFDLDVTLESADAFDLVVRASPDGAERTVVRYEADGTLTLDRRDSSQSDAVATEPQSIPDVPGSDPDRIRLRVLVDASVLELFVNDRTALSSRIYPTRSDSLGVSVRARGGRVQVHSLDVWTLDSAM
ncbi:beta-fructofuranosidase protein [Halorhabdus tiamatea SARL4B]|uniref:beta-fructofuranosidase n=1 Tax=Halorhabdus tiamatea SARL4B TaxID=1033806 RepID=F7PLE8_9EURY|nr:glycoside hydrolase family 32 protein [Halorhabdus tiamatea]ERJ04799.1 beta-fructofuranosidase protein [Halorhabdus tiamatea SARL4B]CCQ33070.1 beta-fructosidase, family GH32 [Halorhabdus tiamatea SARL4B]